MGGVGGVSRSLMETLKAAEGREPQADGCGSFLLLSFL